MREEARGVSPAALVRWSGLLATTAAAYMVLLPFVHPNDAVGTRSAAWVPVHLAYFAVQLASVGSSSESWSAPGGSTWSAL